MLLYLVTLLGLVHVSHGDQWAVLVTGSRGYYNYRHHADVCEAQRLLKARGIKEDHIITMMFDDVANDGRNPFPGQLFNRPSQKGEDAIDVYKDCIKDYTGHDVTPKNLEHILLGEEKALKGVGTGRVLKSKKDDEVFINLVDHGAVGLFAFPSGELLAEDLIKTLKKMHELKMYKNLVFYMEACESGSMFENLEDDWNIYAVSASNAHESSWATYCPPHDDIVQGKPLNTCLGDLFSVNWMQDTEGENPNKQETLFEQFIRVQNKTSKSHVMEFGSIDKFKDDPIDEFMGEADSYVATMKFPQQNDMVNSRDVTLVSKFYAYLRKPSVESNNHFEQELLHRKNVDIQFRHIANQVLSDPKQIKEALRAVAPKERKYRDCHLMVHSAYKSLCQEWSDYSLRYSATLVTLCETIKTPTPILQAFRTVCGSGDIEF